MALDTLEIFGEEFTNVAGIKATDDQSGTKVYIRPQGTKSISANGTGIDVVNYASVDVSVSAPSPSLQSKTYNVSSAGTATVTADSGYDGLSSVAVSVPSADPYTCFYNNHFYTDDNQRQWSISPRTMVDVGEGDTAGWIADGYISDGPAYEVPAVPSNTTITPTTSAQTIGGANYMMEGAVTVAAMPSGTAGTPTATKGTVSNHQVSVTPSVTNTSGYISGGTQTGTAVTVSASELVSGTYTVDSSGTKDVTNYASASVPAGAVVDTWAQDYYFTQNNQRKWHIEGGPYVSAGWLATDNYSGINTDFNAVASGTTITPSTSNQTIGGANYMMEGAVTVSGDQNLSASNIKKNVSIFGVTGTYEGGGGGSSMQIEDNVEASSYTATTLTFTGLKGEPTSYCLGHDTSIATGTPSKVAALVFDGTTIHGSTVTNTANAQVTYDGSSFSHVYSNGTLTITSTGANFQSVAYYITYTYDGSAENIHTADVQVGSGATSITFTGLEGEPVYWSCIFKSNFSSSSGYQRVMYVEHINSFTVGFAMDSQANASNAYWSQSYNNGSLTITSRGTNQGGYFHQPGYYQLTYAYDDGSSGNYQSKTVTPTTSQQVVEADSGYDALKKVTVNAMPTMTLPTTGSATSTGTRKAIVQAMNTRAQYINIPTGYNETSVYYEIPQLILGTKNITQNGTYLADDDDLLGYGLVTVNVSGGGGANIGTKTATGSSSYTSSLQFTSLSGTPKAFFVRLTTQISRSSSNRYYYVENMRWDGSSSGGVAGRCFYQYSGQLTNITSGYSYSYSSGTLTITSSATSRSASPGAFYNGTYELVYIY